MNDWEPGWNTVVETDALDWEDGWIKAPETPKESGLQIIDPLQEGVKDVAKSGVGFLKMMADTARGSNADAFRQKVHAMSDSDILKPDPGYKKSGGFSGYIEDVVRMSPQVAVQLGIAMTPGGQFTSAAFMGSQIAGGKYESLREDDVPVIRAVQASLADAAMQAPLEALSLNKALRAWKPGKKAMEVARDIAGAAGTEALTEAVQKYPDLATEIWAKSKDVPVEDQVNQFVERFGQATKEGLYEGLVAAPFGGMARGAKIALSANDAGPDEDRADIGKNKTLDAAKQANAKLAGQDVTAESPVDESRKQREITGLKKRLSAISNKPVKSERDNQLIQQFTQRLENYGVDTNAFLEDEHWRREEDGILAQRQRKAEREARAAEPPTMFDQNQDSINAMGQWQNRSVEIPDTDQGEYRQMEDDARIWDQAERDITAQKNKPPRPVTQYNRNQQSIEDIDRWGRRKVEIPETDQSTYRDMQEEERYWSEQEEEIRRQRQPKPAPVVTGREGTQQAMSDIERWQGRAVDVPETDQSRYREMEGEERHWDNEKRKIQEQRRPLTPAEKNQGKINAALSDTEQLDRDQNQYMAGTSDFNQKLDMMQQEVNNSETRGVTQEKANQQSETVVYGASSPSWMKDIQAERKANGEPALSRKELNVLFDKARSGQKMTERQASQFEYVKRAMDRYTGEANEFGAIEEAQDMERKGFKPMGGASIPVTDLKEGDKIIGTVGGVKDEYTVKDMDDNGDVLFQDGVARRVDMFDEVTVEGIKRNDGSQKSVAPESEKVASEQVVEKGKIKNLTSSQENLSPQKGNVRKVVNDRINKKYSDIIDLPESGARSDIYEGIIDGRISPENLDRYLSKSDNTESAVQDTKAAIADRLGDLKETYRYEGFEQGKEIEDYIDSLLAVARKHEVSGKPLSDKSRSTQVKSKARGVSDDSGVKFSASMDKTPGQGITLDQIKSQASGQQITTNKDGSLSIRFKNGKGVRVTTVEHIGGDDVRIAMESGRMGKNGKILGKYQNEEVVLNIKLGDIATVAHEFWHMLKDFGILNKMDLAVIRNHHKKLVKQGKYDYEILEDQEENEANTFGQMIKNRADFREKSAMHRVIQKVMDFFDGLIHIGRQSARKLAREYESGKIYSRKVNGKTVKTRIPAYEATAEMWYSSLEKGIENLKQNKAPALQWMGMIKKIPGLKQEELDWVGLNDWLREQKGPILKQDIIDFVRGNGVQVEEVVKTGPSNVWVVRDNANSEEYATEEEAEAAAEEWKEAIADEYNSDNWFEAREYDDPYYGGDDEVYAVFQNGDHGWPVETGFRSEEEAQDWIDNHVEEQIEGLQDMVEVEEGESESGDALKYEEYTLKGGMDYKELLLTLPRKKLSNITELPDGYFVDGDGAGGYAVFHEGGRITPFNTNYKTKEEAISAALPKLEESNIKEPGYKSGHWDEYNVLAHVRFSEREVDGRRVLHIEEIQSDWHQDGRKKGYKIGRLPDGYILEQKFGEYRVKRPDGVVVVSGKTEQQAIEEFEKRREITIPDAPFKKSWPTFAFKRMVRYAAENGFDTIAWTQGKEQAERYDLSKKISKITYDKDNIGKLYTVEAYDMGGKMVWGDTLTAEKLEDNIGKDVTKKIVDSKEDTGELSGLDLRVGGEGMKGFYDQILPAEVKKLFGKKAWGKPRMGEIEIEADGPVRLHAMEITPKMKSKALREGMPLFQTSQDRKGAPSLSVSSDRTTIAEEDAFHKDSILKEATDFASDFVLGNIKNRDLKAKNEKKKLGFLWHHLGSFMHVAKRAGGATERFFDEVRKQADYKYQKQNDLRQDGDYSLFKAIEDLKHDSPLIYKRLNNYIWKRDVDAVGYTVVESEYVNPLDIDPNATTYEIRDKNGEPVEDEYLGDVEQYLSEDAAWEAAWELEAEESRLPDKAKEALIGYRRIARNLYLHYAESLKSVIDAFEKAGKPMPKIKTVQGGKTIKISLATAMKMMGDRQGYYFPRIRNSGEYRVEGKKKDQADQLKFFPSKRMANAFMHRLERTGYEATMTHTGKFDEDLFQQLSPVIAQEQLVNRALEKVGKDVDLAFAESVVKQFEAELKGRGSRARMIGRVDTTGKQVKQGYETDLVAAVAQSTEAAAGGYAKQQIAYNAFKIISGKDISWFKYLKENPDATKEQYKKEVESRRLDAARNPRVYKQTMATLKDILRNQDEADRIIGTMKGAAVVWFLGGRVSSAAVNITNMGLAVPATMKGELGVSFGKAFKNISKAGKLYGQHKFGSTKDKEVAKLFNKIADNGWEAPKFNIEALEALQGSMQKGWGRLIDYSMYMFGVTEKINRATTIAANYMALCEKNNQGLTDKKTGLLNEDFLKQAKDASDLAHGDYGKSNRPYHMRGDHIGARVLQLSYVFQTFAHNYLQEMLRLGLQKKQYKAALYMAFAPAVLGGVGATVPMAVAKAISSTLGGDDPEEKLIEMLGGGDIARFGLPALGGVSLKGSLQTRFGIPEDFVDIFGAPGQVIGDVYDGLKNITKGYYREGIEKALPTALENVSKGHREVADGVTTKSGSPVYFGKEQMRGTSYDTLLRVLSFSPTNITGKKELKWYETKTKSRYQKRKSDLYKRLKRFYSKPPNRRDRNDIIVLNADIRDFNMEIKKRGLFRIVTPITAKSKKTVLKKMRRPPKSERLR